METTNELAWFRHGSLLAIVESSYPESDAPKWLQKGLDEHRITIGYFEPLQGSMEKHDARELAALLRRLEEHFANRER